MVRSYLMVAVLVVLFVSSIVNGRLTDDNKSENNTIGEEAKSSGKDESLGFDETVIQYESTDEDENTNEDSVDKHQRLRRASCDDSRCWSSTGRCVSWGFYECHGSSIRQCVANYEWRTIGNCPSTCRYFGRGINRHPYCI
ncbi:hypothetical protein I4U23_005496 [Adineta vaga]|nr:hypothetical protein I4U23_005496 [Adineta vaga]